MNAKDEKIKIQKERVKKMNMREQNVIEARKFLKNFLNMAKTGDQLTLYKGPMETVERNNVFYAGYHSGNILVNIGDFMHLNGQALLSDAKWSDFKKKSQGHTVKLHIGYTDDKENKNVLKNAWCDSPLGTVTQIGRKIFLNGEEKYNGHWQEWRPHPEGIIVLTDSGNKLTLIKTSGEEQIIYEGPWHQVIGIDGQGILIIKAPGDDLCDYAYKDELFHILLGTKIFFNGVEIPLEERDKDLCLGHPLGGVVIFRNGEYLLNGKQVVGRGLDWLLGRNTKKWYEPFFHRNWMCRIYYGKHTKFLIDETVLFKCECKEREVPDVQHHDMGILINYRGVLHINGQKIYDGPEEDYFATPKGAMIKDGNKFIHVYLTGDDQFSAIVATTIYEGNCDRFQILDENLIIYDKKNRSKIFVVKG
ncbi:hypothetical protein COU00_04400 [Candidatus Falkowbacteria bacterium CG10_big_fil_rev_8_21_14_0_10_43_11]|uniref:Uncharacterized protein n=1 Tax=Candidatus Falkowbacteria bacterium CG10_big_fil_rev_8_21_14_0_10_43_11 TaxID=1974568 RepID=A0A2M6WKX6_9BACT|nr:MAG: hypothetical protein COU00_04400 [Candidatus Falkowbacteria bacterium CG10_big_fil_rev_8_21_14_0_10_43_11]